MFHVKHFVYFVSGAKQERLFRRGFWALRPSIQPWPTADTYRRAEAISAADRREAAAKMQVRFEKTGFLFGKGTGLLLPPVSDGAETASAAGPQHSLCHRIYIAVTDGRLSNTYEHDFGRKKSQSAKSSAKIFINFSRKIK